MNELQLDEQDRAWIEETKLAAVREVENVPSYEPKEPAWYTYLSSDFGVVQYSRHDFNDRQNAINDARVRSIDDAGLVYVVWDNSGEGCYEALAINGLIFYCEV